MNLRAKTDLAGEARDPDSMTCLDVIYQSDAADMEYVLGMYHGWLVMRTAMSDRDDTCVVFDQAFTVQQHDWLVRHHRPVSYLRSWLMICRRRHSVAANEWLLVPAPSTVRFIQGFPTYSEACHLIDAQVCLSLKAVMTVLRSGTGSSRPAGRAAARV